MKKASATLALVLLQSLVASVFAFSTFQSINTKRGLAKASHSTSYAKSHSSTQSPVSFFSCLVLQRKDTRTHIQRSQRVFTPSMTSAYGGMPGTGTKDIERIDAYLPIATTLGNVRVEVAPFLESEWERGRELMNQIIDEGLAWPFENRFDTMDGFRGYFLSHTAFVVRATGDFSDADGGASCTKGEILGIFYVKPNFPGRCSHICNGGFIVVDKFRRLGCGRLMAASFLKFAKDLGYKASYFNLVFANNEASVRLWEGMGFSRVAHIPKCANLKGVEGLVDAYGYYYDLEKLPEDFDPVAASKMKK